jgi:hypothetical protein
MSLFLTLNHSSSLRFGFDLMFFHLSDCMKDVVRKFKDISTVPFFSLRSFVQAFLPV